ncbi:MAG: hypothetical protein M3Y49_16175 [Actinomycetota bacterium]|nr:hypothetical protein [Actinomycetota bacterium]
MTTPTCSRQAALETITAIARLLHRAAERSTDQADAEGPRSALHVRTLGIHLTAAKTALLVPPELDPYWPQPTQDNPLELLRAAEQLARSVPIDKTTEGFSIIVGDIADLLHEAGS